MRDKIAAAMKTGEGPERVYVSAGQNGTALAVIDGETYIREATNPDGYSSAPGSIPEASTLLENIRNQYPWVMNQSPGISFVPIPIDTDTPRYAYVLTLNYPQGNIHAHIDTDTDAVYQEVQRIHLTSLNTSADRIVQDRELTVSISRSFAGGPLYVNVTDRDESPVAAEILINNESVGSTGPDGTMWVIAPTGNFSVTAVAHSSDARVETNMTLTNTKNPAALSGRNPLVSLAVSGLSSLN
ncbi:DUF7094 domain-containing protein [Halospeciosus flavus]|uniref:DUF7094 domain-containing protein n=1 Tax=Halospeciosus flavus TaxID=3032283 RepID=UPI00360631E4